VGRYPSIEEAEAYPYTERELAILRHAQGRTVAGTPERVREQLEALAADYEADELVIVSIAYDPKARRRSYELIAKVFGLEEAGA
jgi:alkanesulfonate monooxygenase SsuD/methylene tetrahydromethanopterin reductase-like flavin-dependent oxidoreductase (luciferase family)